MYKYLIFELISAIIGITAFITLCVYILRHTNIRKIIINKHFYVATILIVVTFITGLIANKTYPPDFAMPAFMHSSAPGGMAPAIHFGKIAEFLRYNNRFEKVANIGADPNAVPAQSQKPDADGVVRINLTAKEVIGQVAPDIYFNYWTYNGQTPGPMLRVREGDTVEVALTNDPSSLHNHNIDLHSVTGPGGGASLTNVMPGETKTFRFKALSPGLYVYHCAMPNVSTHNSHGQYGLILVDPAVGFSKVDKEFYIMQGELYTQGQTGKKGLNVFDSDALLEGIPNYVLFNGKVESTPRMHAKVGDKIRMYVGNGGVNLISSFHVIGEIFDKVYPEAAIGANSSVFENVQTTAILPGGASIVEFTVDVPGKYLLVDHALARMNKGAWAVLEVTGPENPEIFTTIKK